MAKIVHIMVNLKTTGLSQRAGIVQIGAVNIKTQSYFNEYVDSSSPTFNGYEVSASTMAWWDKQSKEVRNRVFSGVTQIKVALEKFLAWVESQNDGDYTETYLWSNHIGFDFPILEQAMWKELSRFPFRYQRAMDYATISNLMIPRDEEPVAHDGLQDAQAQTRKLVEALRQLQKLEVILPNVLG